MISGKVALITGSAQGLGKAFASAILQRGGKVCISDINKTSLEVTFAELRSKFGDSNVECLACDVTDEVQIKDVFQKAKRVFNKIDIVVNNAGIVNEKNWEKCIDINLTGVIRGTLQGLEYLRKDLGGTGGTIVNISSMAGLLPVIYAPAYSASKHGVLAYTRSLALHPEVQKNGVRLVCLCPAYANTDIIKPKAENRTTELDEQIARDHVAALGVMSVDQVTDSFIKLLEDTDNNGSALKVTVKGSAYANLPGDPTKN